MKFINFLVVKLSVFFAAGIAVAEYASPSFSFILKIFCLLCLLLLAIWIRERRIIRPGLFFGILVYLTFFTLGTANHLARKAENSKGHYTQIASELDSEVLQLKIRRILKPSAYYNKYYATVIQVNDLPANGEILLNLSKEFSGPNLNVDDLLLVRARIQPIKGPLNPFQFDYRKYLSHHGINRQLRLSEKQVYKHKKGKTTLRGYADRFRSYIIQKLSKQPFGDRERSIMQALLLGDRDEIDSDLYSKYAAAGALHILAVSGLHVGVLFVIFSFLLSPLERVRRGKQIKVFVVLILLWGFALLAGLSPSVVRAVTMFSFFSLAELLRRPTNGFNTLFLSFLVLLIANPDWLFHVGFQFSYLAVFFILWIQPKLYKCYIPKFKLDKIFWSIFTVTLAAQLGIAPLSIYYFHQFPGLFFLSNLVILPFLGIILSGGIAVIFLSVINALPYPLAMAYNELIALLNKFIVWVANQESFLFKDITLSMGMLICCYLLVLTVIRLLMDVNLRRVRDLMISVIVLLGMVIWEKRTGSIEEFVVFHSGRSTVLGHRHGSKLRLFENDSISFVDRFPVKSYRIGSGVSKLSSEHIPDVFRFKGKTILRLDSLSAYPSEEIDILLLTRSPKIHLERIIDSLKPTMIIADGSNFPWDVKRWRTTCAERNIDFHYTANEGAYVLSKNRK